MRKLVTALVLVALPFFSHAQSGYDIIINLKNCKDTTAYLTFYQFDKTYIKDTCTAIKNGKILFKGKEKLPTGMYSLVGQQKSILFDFFIDETNQKLELESNEFGNYGKDIKAVNSNLENEFFEYVRFIGNQNQEYSIAISGQKSESKKDSTDFVQSKRKILEDKLDTYEKVFIEKNKNTFIARVINLKKDKLLKDIPKASNGRPDSLKVYQYFKKHYWDGVDFQEDAILRTPFFSKKMNIYLESVIFPHPDSISVSVNSILDQTKQGSLMYKLLLNHFTYTFESSKKMGYDKVFVNLVDRYFKTGKAVGLYEDENILANIIKRSDKLKPLLIDQKAPELAMIRAEDGPRMLELGFENVKTSDELTKIFYDNYQELEKKFFKLETIEAKYTVLVFWDVDCGHCQKEIPILLEDYHKMLKDKIDVKFFSVYTQHDVAKYQKYIKEHNLDWINVYDGAHYNNVTDRYDVYSTPVIYLLDKDKVIKAKRIGAAQVREIIAMLEKAESTAK